MVTQSVRVRFAPSPTGHLHIGGVRTAFFNWLFARHTGGKYLLRIEDTDLQRSTKEFLAAQLAAFEWLQLLPDEQIVYQMARIEEHRSAVQKLMAMGKAYPCFCAPRDSDEVVQGLDQGIGSKYPGTCRDKQYTAEDLMRSHAVRLRLPDQPIAIGFNDVIRGSVSIKSDQLDDFVLMRRDSIPTYNFGVVIDDEAMRITHVIRGEEHLSNTFKQLLIYEALGFTPPIFAHLPLILGKAGNKLSKRDAAVSIEYYREEGFLPEAMLNYLARLGWAHGDQEIFTREELVQFFTLEAVGKKGAIFDMEKLRWVNGVHLRQLSSMQLLTAIAQMGAEWKDTLTELWSADKLNKLFHLYGQRSTTLKELAQGIVGLAHDPGQLDMSLIDKWKTEKTKDLVSKYAAWLGSQEGVINHEQLLAYAEALCKQEGEKLVSLAQALRLGILGCVQSPGVFELIEILGVFVTHKRLMTLLSQW